MQADHAYRSPRGAAEDDRAEAGDFDPGAYGMSRVKTGANQKGPVAWLVSGRCGFGLLLGGSVLLLVAGSVYLDAQQQRSSLSLERDSHARTKEAGHIAALGSEARLLRLSSILEAHLSRDKRHAEDMRLMTNRMAHSASLFRRDVDKLTSSSLHPAALKRQLLNMTDQIAQAQHAIALRHTRRVIREGAEAEALLRSLADEMTAEVKARATLGTDAYEQQADWDAEIEHRYLEHRDKVKAERSARNRNRRGRKRMHVEGEEAEDEWEAEGSQQRAVEQLRQLDDVVATLRDASASVDSWLNGLSQKDVDAWTLLLAQVRSGDKTFEEGEAMMEAALQKLPPVSSGMMKQIGRRQGQRGATADDFAGLLNEQERQSAARARLLLLERNAKPYEQFEALINFARAKSRGTLAKITAQLKKWKRGELPAAGMIQHLQRLMHDGHLDPRWLWSGELAAQGKGKGTEGRSH